MSDQMSGHMIAHSRSKNENIFKLYNGKYTHTCTPAPISVQQSVKQPSNRIISMSSEFLWLLLMNYYTPA